MRITPLFMVWKKLNVAKKGKWVGPGTVIGTHHGSVWINMKGSLWKCSQLQCKLATTDESRGLEIQNALAIAMFRKKLAGMQKVYKTTCAASPRLPCDTGKKTKGVYAKGLSGRPPSGRPGTNRQAFGLRHTPFLFGV